MALSREEVRKVAALAGLELSEEEEEAYRGQLGTLLGLVDKLGELELDDLEPSTHAVVSGGTPLRADEVLPSLEPEEALANAPAREGQSFAVPRILE